MSVMTILKLILEQLMLLDSHAYLLSKDTSRLQSALSCNDPPSPVRKTKQAVTMVSLWARSIRFRFFVTVQSPKMATSSGLLAMVVVAASGALAMV